MRLSPVVVLLATFAFRIGTGASFYQITPPIACNMSTNFLMIDGGPDRGNDYCCYHIEPIRSIVKYNQRGDYMTGNSEYFEAINKCHFFRSVLSDTGAVFTSAQLLATFSDQEMDFVGNLLKKYIQKLSPNEAANALDPVTILGTSEGKGWLNDVYPDFNYIEQKLGTRNFWITEGQDCLYYSIISKRFTVEACRKQNSFRDGRFSLAVCKSFGTAAVMSTLNTSTLPDALGQEQNFFRRFPHFVPTVLRTSTSSTVVTSSSQLSSRTSPPTPLAVSQASNLPAVSQSSNLPAVVTTTTTATLSRRSYYTRPRPVLRSAATSSVAAASALTFAVVGAF